jgi:acyl carrier protein
LADVQIVCALEERFGIKISDEEAQHAKTVAEIVHLVQRKITCNAI